MDEKDRRFIEELSVKHTEKFQQFIGAITESQQVLLEKLDRIESGLGLKLDKIAAEVAAHRADTEAHHGIYRVKEVSHLKGIKCFLHHET